MQHLNEEELILLYYGEHAGGKEHLLACPECRAEYDTLSRVLALVDEAPVPERGETYGAEVYERLRWKVDARREARGARRSRFALIAIAAGLIVAFFAGQLWHQHMSAPAQKAGPQIALTSPTSTSPAAAAQSTNDRFLILIVNDHLDSTERVLLEVANADPKKDLDVSGTQKRAEELVASNRIYRQTANRQGDARIASLLADIEPVLMELSHAGTSLRKDELVSLQKRIEAQGLLFKVRVVGVQTEEQHPVANANTL